MIQIKGEKKKDIERTVENNVSYDGFEPPLVQLEVSGSTF